MAKVTESLCWILLFGIILLSSIMSCQSQTTTKATCELQMKRTILPAGKFVDSFCIANLTAVITRPVNSKCTLKNRPTVDVRGMEKLDVKLKHVKLNVTTTGDIIEACLMLDNPANYKGQNLSSVIGEQNHTFTVMLHFIYLYEERACWFEGLCEFTGEISFDEAPTIVAEVRKQLTDNQTAVVEQNDKVYMCCGECGGNVTQTMNSGVSINLITDDADWRYVARTNDTFSLNHSIKFKLVNTTKEFGGDQLGSKQWTNYTTYSVVERQNSQSQWLTLSLTKESLCNWVGKSVLERDVSSPNLTFCARVEVLVEASVSSGVEVGYLLSRSTEWRGVLEFGNKLPEAVSKAGLRTTMIPRSTSYMLTNATLCYDGIKNSCDGPLEVAVGKLLQESSTWIVIGIVLVGVLAAVACAVVLYKMNERRRSKRDARTEGSGAVSGATDSELKAAKNLLPVAANDSNQ